MPSPRRKLIEHILKRLEEKSWTKRQLAQESGLSSTLVHKVLSPKNLAEGHIPVSQKFCIHTANALSEPPEKYLALAGYLQLSTDEVDDVAAVARQLDEERVEMLKRFARFLLEEQRIVINESMAPHDRRPREISQTIHT